MAKKVRLKNIQNLFLIGMLIKMQIAFIVNLKHDYQYENGKQGGRLGSCRGAFVPN